jgi:curved DNA-binding protein CbpA
MPNPYEILGVTPDVDDASLRRRYLELTREFSPEAAPEKFAAMRHAYERVQTANLRAMHFLRDGREDESIETLADDAAKLAARKRNTLDELITATEPPSR